MLEDLLKLLLGGANVKIIELTPPGCFGPEGSCIKCGAKGVQHYYFDGCEETVAKAVYEGRCPRCEAPVVRNQCHCRSCAVPLSNRPSCEQKAEGVKK